MKCNVISVMIPGTKISTRADKLLSSVVVSGSHSSGLSFALATEVRADARNASELKALDAHCVDNTTTFSAEVPPFYSL